jgi:hypothetical protein
MVKCGVLFEVRTEFLNIIDTNFVFKGLIMQSLQFLAQYHLISSRSHYRI